MKLVSAIIFFTSLVCAQVQWPVLDSPVVDQVGWLASNEKVEIENLIRSFHGTGKAQIQVVIVKDLQGLPVENYSIQLVERWKLGDTKRDDGILFLVSSSDRKMRIEVGQGLEGLITDLHSKRILDDRVRPLFKSRNYAAGIAAGVVEIINAIDPNYTGHSVSRRPVARNLPDEQPAIWFLIALFILMNIIGRRRRRSGILPFLGGFGAGYGMSRGGGWSSGSGGGWSGGGGGFSGGGASSDW